MAKKTEASVGRLHGPKARKAADFESRGALAKSTACDGAAAPEFSGAVRVVRLQIGDIEGDAKSTLSRWRALSEMCQQVSNEYWKQWVLWHEINGSFEAVAAWYSDIRKWHESEAGERGGKPRCAIKATPPECQRAIYQKLAERFPALNNRCVALLMNSIGKEIRTRKAARGSLAGWQAVLLSHEAIPSATRPLPIPFDKENARPSNWSENEKGETVVRLRVDRVEPEPGKKTATSHVDEFALRLKSKSAYRQRVTLDRVKSGEYDFKGSSLFYDKPKRKWYLLLCYQQPKQEPPKGDPALVAHVWAGEDHPWSIEINGRDIWVGGWGRSVPVVRRNLMSQRASRKHNYRNAGSANKGHGRNRALGPVFRLSRRWKDYVKRFNHEATTRMVALCREHGVGAIVYHQPDAEYARSRFLAKAGQDKWIRDQSSWDWFQVGTFLAYKGGDAGISITVEKESEVEEPVA